MKWNKMKQKTKDMSCSTSSYINHPMYVIRHLIVSCNDEKLVWCFPRSLDCSIQRWEIKMSWVFEELFAFTKPFFRLKYKRWSPCRNMFWRWARRGSTKLVLTGHRWASWVNRSSRSTKNSTAHPRPRCESTRATTSFMWVLNLKRFFPVRESHLRLHTEAWWLLKDWTKWINTFTFFGLILIFFKTWRNKNDVIIIYVQGSEVGFVDPTSKTVHQLIPVKDFFFGVREPVRGAFRFNEHSLTLFLSNEHHPYWYAYECEWIHFFQTAFQPNLTLQCENILSDRHFVFYQPLANPPVDPRFSPQPISVIPNGPDEIDGALELNGNKYARQRPIRILSEKNGKNGKKMEKNGKNGKKWKKMEKMEKKNSHSRSTTTSNVSLQRLYDALCINLNWCAKFFSYIYRDGWLYRIDPEEMIVSSTMPLRQTSLAGHGWMKCASQSQCNWCCDTSALWRSLLSMASSRGYFAIL